MRGPAGRAGRVVDLRLDHFVGVSRKTKNFHETVRVATKWTLRCIAASLLHNAFKAPVAQFLVYLVLIALYARTRVLKATGKKEYYREEKAE